MGPFLATREAAKVMMPKRAGKIINIGSISGKRPLATRTPYTTSKLGLVGMTRTAAAELGEYNINVNVLSPGAVDNDRMTELSQRWGIDRDKFRAGAAALAPLKRVSENEDIASVALFLATDRSRNITGFDINCDAGCSRSEGGRSRHPLTLILSPSRGRGGQARAGALRGDPFVNPSRCRMEGRGDD